MTGALIIAGGIVVYFIPTFVAYAYKRRNGNAIAVLNLLLGWTGLGWIGALIWALMPDSAAAQSGTKAVAVLALMLAAAGSAGATPVTYTFQGVVDASNWEEAPEGQTMTGSFVLNYDAPIAYQNGTAGGHYDAVSGIRYQIGNTVYEQAGTWDWTVCDLPDADRVGFQDAIMGGGDEINASLGASGGPDEYQGTDLANSSAWDRFPVKQWFLNSIKKVGETVYYLQTGGRITSVSSSSGQLASARFGGEGDAVPTPEPASAVLLGLGLAAAGIYRRRKNRR